MPHSRFPNSEGRRRRHTPRTPFEWFVRGVLALVATGLGYGCVTFSMAQVGARANPAFAHSLAPYHGPVTARFAASLIDEQQPFANALARQAVLQDPTVTGAITTLGINAQVRGDVAAARRLFAYGLQLSRRDSAVLLWAIEDAVARNDIPGALRYYDIALRTSPRLSDVLFPVLTSASTDSDIRTSLIHTLSARPPWGDGFVNFLSVKGTDPRANAVFVRELIRKGMSVPGEALANTTNALIAAGYGDDAWAFYAAYNPQADRTRSRDPHFASSRQAPSVLDWATIDTDGISASIQAGDKGGVLDFVASPSASGTVARQVELLPQGTYRLQGRSSGVAQVENGQSYWLLRCQDNRELLRVALDNSREGERTEQQAIFKVPSNCPVQFLELVVRPSDSSSGSTGQVDYLLIQPAS